MDNSAAGVCSKATNERYDYVDDKTAARVLHFILIESRALVGRLVAVEHTSKQASQQGVRMKCRAPLSMTTV